MAEPAAPNTALITNDAVVLGLLAVTLGAVFWTSSRESGFWKKFYGYVPALLMCYLLPAIYNSIGLIDGNASGLYPMARDYLLPSALVLLCIAIDLGAVLRLGPKAVIMFLTGTLGVMVGALVSFVAMGVIHPDTVSGDTWRGMTTVAGSWIGGGANQAAMKEVFAVDATLFGQFVAVDVLVANPAGGFVPQISKREVSTAVLIDNGQTVVVGGVYEFSSREDLRKVPFLGDLPVLGNLFKNKSKSSDKAELLIFVTPRILPVSRGGLTQPRLEPRTGPRKRPCFVMQGMANRNQA